MDVVIVRAMEDSPTSQFVAAYRAYFESDIALSNEAWSLADEESRQRVEDCRLRGNMAGRDILRALETQVGPLPEDVVAFFRSPGTLRPLDALLMELPGLGAAAGFERMERMLRLCSPGLLPFGVERDGYGLGNYCVDLREGVTRGAVVYCPHPTLDAVRHPSEPLASSFGDMLRVLAWLLTTPVPWSDLDASDVQALRAIDPRGFGGDAWDRWWKRRVLGA